MTDTVPAVASVWTRHRDAATTTITTIHGEPNVQYETSWPDRSDKGVGISNLGYFLAHHAEDSR